MLKATDEQPKPVICLLCGRPAASSICECCVARVQGQAIELKRQDERRGSVETTRH